MTYFSSSDPIWPTFQIKLNLTYCLKFGPKLTYFPIFYQIGHTFLIWTQFDLLSLFGPNFIYFPKFYPIRPTFQILSNLSYFPIRTQFDLLSYFLNTLTFFPKFDLHFQVWPNLTQVGITVLAELRCQILLGRPVSSLFSLRQGVSKLKNRLRVSQWFSDLIFHIFIP